MTDDTPTVPEAVCRAAESLGDISFTPQELAVRAWKMFPALFGLPGFEELHPDSKKVEAVLYGTKGLVRQGCLVKDGPRFDSHYRFVRPWPHYTGRPGRSRGTNVAAPATSPTPADVPTLDREQAARLTWRLTPANYWHSADPVPASRDVIDFKAALAFWELTPESTAVDAHLEAVARELAELVGHEDGVILPSGRHVAPGELRALANLHDSLLQRFRPHLELMRPRRKGAPA